MKRLLFYALALGLVLGAGCHKAKNPLGNEYPYASFSKYIQYSNWHQASAPVSANVSFSQKGHLYWYNPYEQVPLQEIWPDRDISTQYGASDRIGVLTLVFPPNPSIFPSTGSWAGIQIALPQDSLDPIASASLDLWIKGDDGCLHIDIGQISEDVIPNDLLDTEDRIVGFFRNGILDDGEDTGPDGVFGSDPPNLFYPHEDARIDDRYATPFDFWDLDTDSIKNENEPWSYDDWSSDDYIHLNGTENSLDASVAIFLDTEDLNQDEILDDENAYFEYKLRLEKDGPDTVYLVKGYPESYETTGWHHYRIPLDSPTSIVQEVHRMNTESIRIWIDGIDVETFPEGEDSVSVSLASFHFSRE